MELRDLEAPFFYSNWKAALAKEPLLGISEFPLFSDVHLIGEFKEDCGPYQFIHLVGKLAQCGVAKPVLILRISSHIDVSVTLSDMEKTREDLYHGGDPANEMAALVSLALGVRLKAGDLSREFPVGGDPLGIPREFGLKPVPVIPMGGHGLVLPNACGAYTHRDLGEALKPLTTLPNICPSDATALVRAARLYQDALWIIESEPSLAWVMLVSAIEAAASHWRSSGGNAFETVRDLDADLYELLQTVDDGDLAKRVAKNAARTLKSTKKFLDFCAEFLPLPPPERPEHESARHSWDLVDILDTIKKVYGYRSRALHDGLPFPAPMCQPPMKIDRKAPPEKPIVLASSSGYGTWRVEDTPILLHTYEYIVRGSLLKWWDSLGSRS